MDTPKAAILIIYFASGLLGAHADEQLRSTQEELRRRNIYFGEVDGANSPEMSEAIRNYQQRKGFAATGQVDAETLRSLGLLARQPGEAPPKELAWPAEPVLKSDVKVDAPAIAEQIAQQNNISVGSMGVAPARAKRRAGNDMAAKTPDGDEAGGVKSGGHAGGKSRNATPPAIGEYISDYLKAASRNDLHNQLQFYADRVNYFHNGKLDRRIVEKVLLAYQERWQKRRYVLVGAVMYRKLPSTGEMSVQYRVNFVLKKDRVVVRGQTTNYVVIDAATADPRIIDIQEERVRN